MKDLDEEVAEARRRRAADESVRVALTPAHPDTHGNREGPEQRQPAEQHPGQHDEQQRRHEHAAECPARSTTEQADGAYPSVNCRY
jgi:hypothetical protein